MRVLLVALHFPPENVVASLRTGHIAAGLAELGADVVVATRHAPSGGLCIPGLDELEIVSVEDGSEGWRRRVDRSLDHAGAHRRALWSPRTRLRKLLKSLSRAIPPDRHVGWALRLLHQLRGLARPDVILVSVPPMSALLVGALVARRHKVPLVVDYRDSLVNNPYNELAYPLRVMQRRLERLLTRGAVHVTSVSQPLVRELAEALSLPGTVVMNGFDQADFAGLDEVGGAKGSALVVTFCGHLHVGKSDPGPLFEAVSIARGEGHEVALRFFGPNTQVLESLVLRHDLQAHVTLGPMVDHAQAVRLEKSSDVLLQLSRHDPADHAVVGGKLLEYMGAGRPILLVGYEHGVAAELVREHDLGVASTDPVRIAEALRTWCRRKEAMGGLPPVGDARLRVFTRRHQNEVLHELLRGAVGGSA